MLPKPMACRSCPLWQDGKGFVPDHIPDDAEVVVLAQNPGECEEQGKRLTGYVSQGRRRSKLYESVDPQPLIGPTGYELRTTFIPLAEIKGKVGYANVLKCRWIENGKRSNNLPTGEVYEQAVKTCTENYLRIPASAKVIVAHGAHSWNFTQGTTTRPITDWRGYISESLLPTHGGSHRRIAVYATIHTADLFRNPSMRLPARMDWKRLGRYLRGEWPRPVPDFLVIREDTQAVDMHRLFDRAEQAPFVAIDTEYVVESGLLTLVGIGWPVGDTIEGVQLEWLRSPVSSRVRSEFIRRLALLIRKVPVVFQNALADVPILERAFHFGWHAYRQIDDTMQAHAVLWSEMDHDLGYLASLMGAYPKLKHLQGQDEVLYNKGDVLETVVIWQALAKELAADPGSERVYREQNLRLLPIIDRRQRAGLRVNQDRVLELLPKYRDKLAIAEAMAHAYAGWPINLGSPGNKGQFARHLLATENIELESIDKDDIATERGNIAPFDATYEQKQGLDPAYVMQRIEKDGAHPMLELRAMWAKDRQVLSHYLEPLIVEDK